MYVLREGLLLGKKDESVSLILNKGEKRPSSERRREVMNASASAALYLAFPSRDAKAGG